MKALSLWQPWASAIAVGAKHIETRGWPTSYRGQLAIHAAKRKVLDELRRLHACRNWKGAMGWTGAFDHDFARLPFGGIVAIANLVDCRRTEAFRVDELDIPRIPPTRGDAFAWTERQMGNYEPGRYGWVLADIKPLQRPIPFKGAQLLFEIPDELLSEFSPAKPGSAQGVLL